MKRYTCHVALLGLLWSGAANAQSAEWMMEDCAVATQSYFQDFAAKTEMQDQGQRTDGTYAINGTIALETHSDNVQCSYAPDGQTMVDFFAEGASHPDFARGGKSPYMH